MKHDVSFVTCVYDDLHDTEFAGRHNRGTHYAFSLAQMHEMGAPIYCFSDKRNMIKYMPTFLLSGTENYRFINYNLNDSPYFDQIQAVKDSNPELYRNSPSWESRCLEIMWGKFDFITHVALKMGLDSGKFLYWIDAGLSHPGVLPKRFNSVHPDKEADGGFVTSSHEYSYRFKYNRIFNPDLPDYLAEYTGEDKLLHFFCTCPQHSDPSHLEIEGGREFVGTAVGGLFGGNVRMMYEWAEQAKGVCKDLLDHGFLLKEEDVLSYMINLNMKTDPSFKDKLTMYLFDTWYHEDWTSWSKDVYDPDTMISFSDFFLEFTEKVGR